MYTPTAYCGSMPPSTETTAMIHYECYVCHVSATCVVTPSATLAWCDHMANHADPTHYGQWTWSVVPLPLGQ